MSVRCNWRMCSNASNQAEMQTNSTMCSFFFQDRERKILQLERQLDEQSGRLLALGSLNSDIPTTENTMERGRNGTWVFKVQFTSGNVYKQANFSFACRSHRQDNEESQRRIAETMWREGRGRSCLVFNKSGNNDCKLCLGSRLKDLHCRQKHEDSCKWALGLSKKKPLLNCGWLLPEAVLALFLSVKPSATVTSHGKYGASWK